MELLFYPFAALLIWLSIRSFRGGFEYLRYFRKGLSKPESDFTPLASIIAPCRGIEEGIEENLSALFTQNYPDYEIVFVVDDPNDPAATVIDQQISKNPQQPAKLIVAAEAITNSQKVANLREAVKHISDESKAFVFVDSDARPSPGWLRSLVAPLADTAVGAATGYRWFVSPDPTLGSEMRSAWNASIASALGPKDRSNFCWGGSTAILRETFERLSISERWKVVVSDDFTLTAAINEAGMAIRFVPAALTASVGTCTLRAMLEFTTRQLQITRVYAPRLWLASLMGSSIFCGVMIAGFMIVLLTRPDRPIFIAAAATLALVTFFSIGKTLLRLKAVRLVLTDYEAQLTRQAWAQSVLWLVTPAIFWFNSTWALISRRITWCGTVYELKSARETVIIAD
ncbi:MAG: glycosyltransferase [Pyrinomonadaceae bacterium]